MPDLTFRSFEEYFNTDFKGLSMFVDEVKSISRGDNLILVENKSDLPNPADGVITLNGGNTYLITTDVDLEGDRIVADGVVNLFGLSSETSFLTSTGLGVGVPLISSEYTLVVESLSIRDVDTAFSIDGSNRIVALDWKALNFIEVPNVGTINTCDNFIYDTGAFLGAQGLVFTGEVGTIAFNNSLFRGLGSAGNIIEIDANADVTRRFRIIYSSIIAFGDTVGINFNENADVLVESYILDTVNFSGGGTFTSGVDTDDNKTLFINCVGINNTSVNGQMFFQDNDVATVIENTTDFVKVAGETSPSDDNEKYDHSDNRLTNRAIIARKYIATATVSFTSGANNVVEFGIYDSTIDDIRTPSRIKSTASSGGRAENITLQCVVNHSDGDFLELWVRNTSASTNVTASDMNFVISEIK